MSAKRIPTRSILSLYAGPIPLPVVPTTLSVESYMRWNGSMTDARSDMNNRDSSGRSPANSLHESSSRSSTHGSITIPSPRTRLQCGVGRPDGIWCSFSVVSPITIVWPALLPPWNRTVQPNLGANWSMAFPFPSSPHWAPSTTVAGTVSTCSALGV